MPLALLALAISAFGIGTTEFVMMGLLPAVAGDFGVSIPTAGHLISAYALGVVVGAPLLTAVTVRLPRKTVLLALMGVFTVGNLLSALATSHELLLAARFLTGLPHGAFFGAGATVAAGMVPRDKRAKALSMMFLGLTLANVAGVPAGTALGTHLGWRWTFTLIAAIGLVSIASITALVPHQPQERGASLGRELTVFRRPQVWLALSVVMFGFAGIFACFSYISPLLTEVAGYAPASVPYLLVLFGVGMTVGNLLGGRLADRALMPSVYAFLTGLAVMLALFVFTSHNALAAAVTIFLIGVAGFAAGPMMQTRILDKAEDAPTLASAAIQSAFNTANSLGAYLGGLVIAAGLGLTAPNWVGALLAALGLALAATSGVLERRDAWRAVTTPPEPEPEHPEPAGVGRPGS